MSESRQGTTSRRAFVWVVALAGASFVLAFVLIAFADNLGEPVSAGPDSFSRSALGHRALAEFLREGGLEVGRRRAERQPALDETTLLVLAEPRASDDDARLPWLADSAATQGAQVLVVVPKRMGIADPANPRWVARVVELGPGASLETVAGLAGPDARLVAAATGTVDCDTAWGTRLRVQLQAPRLLTASEGWQPVVTCPGGLLVARVADESLWTNVLFVSDPDVLNNLGLAVADHARLVQELLTEGLGVRAVLFDETIHGHVRNSGLVAELLRYPLVLAVLHVGLLAGLVVWAGAGRFGKPVPADPPALDGKQALIESTSQLLRLSSRPADLLRDYFRQTLRAVAEHYNLPPDLPESAMLERLAGIGRAKEIAHDVGALDRAVRDLARRRPTRAEGSIRLAGEIYAWRKEITGVA